MAKKKKKKPVPPEVKFKRKVKKYFKRLVKLAILIAAYFWLLPKVLPSTAPQVEKSKQSISHFATKAQEQIATFLGRATEMGFDISSKKKEIESQGTETIVQDTVDDLKRRVRALPGEQVKKVKREFCSDLIDEALKQATQSSQN
jgi:hypothetical protein